MITITTTTEALKEYAEKVMNEEVLRNPNLNGADFLVQIGDYDSIDGVDEIIGMKLYILVFRHQDDE